MKKAMSLIVVLALSFSLVACSSPDEADGGNNTSQQPDSEGTNATPSGAEQLEATDVEPLPFNASGLLAGDAQPSLPDGDPGEVSVIQVGPLDPDRGTLVFAFRNNTSEGISHVDWSATARSDGALVASGSSQGATPSQIEPGGIGMAYIYFDNSESIPDGADYEFEVSTSPVDTSSYNTAPLTVTEANLVGDSIVGTATNQTGAEVTGPSSVSIYCFDGDDLVREKGTYTDQDGDIPDGGTVTFSQRLYGDSCPTFAVGVSGYFSR